MRVVLGVLIVVILAILGFFAWMYSGVFDVAANKPHSKPVHWVLETVKRQSIRDRAGGIEVPPLADPMLVEEGARTFDENCRGCHGAPGNEARPLAGRMNPEPPDLSKEAREWTSAELFWIVRNGIKMTGMPAWDESRVEDEIWALVAFIGQMPEMSAERYRQLAAPQPQPEEPPAEEPPAEAPPSGGGEDLPPQPQPQ